MHGTGSGAHAPYRGGPAVIAVCLGCGWLGTPIAMALTPALPLIAAEFGHGREGTSIAQLIQTFPAILMIVGAALCGYVSQRFGRRAVMTGALLVYSLSGASGLFLDSLEMLVASRVLLGLAGGAMLTTSYAMFGEYFEGPRREKIIGLVSMTGSLSAVTTLLIGGPMVDAFGWRSPFLLYLPGLILVPFALMGMHKGPTKASGVTLGWKPIFAIWPFLLLLTAFTIGMYMSVIQSPFLIVQRAYGGATMIGMLVAVTSSVGALGGFLYGTMRRYLDFRGMFTLISLVLGTGMMICMSAPNMPLFVLGSMVLGMGCGIIEPTIASEILNRTEEPLHDRAMGAVIAALFLGQFLNPIVIAPLRDIGGMEFAFKVIGGAYLAAGLLFILSRMHRRNVREVTV